MRIDIIGGAGRHSPYPDDVREPAVQPPDGGAPRRSLVRVLGGRESVCYERDRQRC